jgi:hypothetical protein
VNWILGSQYFKFISGCGDTQQVDFVKLVNNTIISNYSLSVHAIQQGILDLILKWMEADYFKLRLCSVNLLSSIILITDKSYFPELLKLLPKMIEYIPIINSALYPFLKSIYLLFEFSESTGVLIDKANVDFAIESLQAIIEVDQKEKIINIANMIIQILLCYG